MSKYYFFDIFIFRTKRFRISSLVLSAIIHFFFRFRTLSIKHKKRYLQYVNTSSIYDALLGKSPNKNSNKRSYQPYGWKDQYSFYEIDELNKILNIKDEYNSNNLLRESRYFQKHLLFTLCVKIRILSISIEV